MDFAKTTVANLDSNFMVASGMDVPNATLATQSIMSMWQKDARVLNAKERFGSNWYNRNIHEASCGYSKRHC